MSDKITKEAHDLAQKLETEYAPETFVLGYIAGATRNTTDPECLAATGHKNNDVRMGYDQGYADHQNVMMQHIDKWDGTAGSSFGQAMCAAMDRNRVLQL